MKVAGRLGRLLWRRQSPGLSSALPSLVKRYSLNTDDRLTKHGDFTHVFDNIIVLTNGANETSSVSVVAYNNLIRGLNLGIGSTMSVLIFLTIAIIAFVFIKLFGAAAPGAQEGDRR